MITPDTTITIGEVSDWQLHWMCVDAEYNILKKELTLEQTVEAVDGLVVRRMLLMQQWNTIYDHPTGLEDELRKNPKWIELDRLIAEAKQRAHDKSMAAHRDMLKKKLGI